MVTVKRNAPGYHEERLPDGQVVLVNDRTGNVAVTNPYTGEITGEVPKNQVASSGAPPSAVTAPGTKPGGTIITPKPGIGGGAPPPAGGAAPAAPTAPAAGTGNPPPPTGPNAMTPGSDVYDWYSVNDALRNTPPFGDGNWQIAGTSHSPVAETKWVKNPAADPLSDNYDENAPPYITEPGEVYHIGIVNKTTGQMFKLTLGKAKQDPANPSSPYTWSITDRQDQGKVETAQGYKDVQREVFNDGHEELWGTNVQTGAFEKMPSSPPNLGKLPGWSDVKQIETTDANGNRVLTWVGTNPQGQPLQPIQGAPTTPVGKYVAGSIRQVTKNGKQVWVGQNAQTQQFEDIPELGSAAVAPTTTTVGGRVYIPNPRAGEPGQDAFIPASGVSQPTDGATQWVDAGGGYVKQQKYQNGSWSDDPGTPWEAVNPTTVRANAAIKPKGTPFWIPNNQIPGTMIKVIADGNGGFDYPSPDQGEVKPIPGGTRPETVQAGTGEFLPPRRDPVTQQLLPPERNPSWTPTATADQTRQLQDLARQKQSDLHQQVTSGRITEQEADQQFNAWWDSDIEPRKQALVQKQQQETVDQQLKLNQERRAQESQRMNLYTSAQAQGQTALSNYMAQAKNMVGPGFGQYAQNLIGAVSQGKMPPLPNVGDFSYMAPDYNQLAQYYTAQALKYISPTAANLTGTEPNVPSTVPTMDIGSMVNRTRFSPNAGGQPSITINVGGGAGAGVSTDTASGVTPAAGITPIAPIAQVPGQNYGAATAYTGGINPWNVQPNLGQFQYPTG